LQLNTLAHPVVKLHLCDFFIHPERVQGRRIKLTTRWMRCYHSLYSARVYS